MVENGRDWLKSAGLGGTSKEDSKRDTLQLQEFPRVPDAPVTEPVSPENTLANNPQTFLSGKAFVRTPDVITQHQFVTVASVLASRGGDVLTPDQVFARLAEMYERVEGFVLYKTAEGATELFFPQNVVANACAELDSVVE